MRTILRRFLTAFGAASLATFALVFGAALARDRKRQQREREWLRKGGRDAP